MLKISLLFITIIIVGCNKSEGPTTSVAGVTYDQIAGDSGGKTWSNCFIDEYGDEVKYTIAFGLTSGDSYNYKFTQYELDLNDDYTNCHPDYEAFENETEGTFNVTARKLYIVESNHYFTTFTSNTTESFNDSNFCGFNDNNSPWVEDVRRLITNLNCGDLLWTAHSGFMAASYHTNYIKVDGINFYLEE
jgi:hypothetical protein